MPKLRHRFNLPNKTLFHIAVGHVLGSGCCSGNGRRHVWTNIAHDTGCGCHGTQGWEGEDNADLEVLSRMLDCGDSALQYDRWLRIRTTLP